MLLPSKHFDPIYQIEVLWLHNLSFLSLYLLHAKLSEPWDTYRSGSDYLHLALEIHYQELAFPAQINDCLHGTSAVLRNGITLISPSRVRKWFVL